MFLLLALVPVILILTGMVLGFRALHDIRGADGALGGAVMATVAAGLFPAMFIVGACGAAVMLLGQGLTSNRPSPGILLSIGAGAGVCLSFLMMRGMHRTATGWTSPEAQPAAPAQTGLAAAAMALTIIGGAMMLFMFLMPGSPYVSGRNYPQFVMLDLIILLAGLICGVLGRRGSAGKACAWISGSLFVLLLIMVP